MDNPKPEQAEKNICPNYFGLAGCYIIGRTKECKDKNSPCNPCDCPRNKFYQLMKK